MSAGFFRWTEVQLPLLKQGAPTSSKATVGRPTDDSPVGDFVACEKAGRIGEPRQNLGEGCATCQVNACADSCTARNASVLILARGGGWDAAEDRDAGAA